MAVDGIELQIGQSLTGTQIACIENCNQLLDYAFAAVNAAPLSSSVSPYRYAEMQLFLRAEEGTEVLTGEFVLSCSGPDCVVTSYTHTFQDNTGILWTVCRSPAMGQNINCSLSWTFEGQFKGANVIPLRSLLRERLCATPGTGFGEGSICIDGAYPINNTTFTFYGGTFPEPPPPPPQSEFCPDGTEVLSDTVLIPAEGMWQKTVTAPERLYARFTFTEPGQIGLLHRITMDVNDARLIRKFYGDEVIPWDPATGEYQMDTAWSFTVPNRTQSDKLDYDPGGYVTGPEVNLSVKSGYNPINLVSVCLVPVRTSAWCDDGIEMVTEPVFLEQSDEWENTLTELGDLTHVVVRYVVEAPAATPSPIDPNPAYTLGKFMPQIQTMFYYVEVGMNGGQEVTFTLPVTNTIPLYDDFLFLRFYNRYQPVMLNSVCVIDGDEEHKLTSEDCLLKNPDFVTAPNPELDWHGEGVAAQWYSGEENGAVKLEGSRLYQKPMVERGQVWELEVRARDVTSGNTLLFGTERTALVAGGAQIEEAELGVDYDLYRNKIFITTRPQDTVLVESEGAMVDYVCLLPASNPFDTDNGAIDEFVTSMCEGRGWPEWNPEGSSDSLLEYLFHWIGDVLLFVLCMILRVLQTIMYSLAGFFGAIWDFFQDLLFRIPGLPDPDSGQVGWYLWFAQLFEGFLDWFGLTVPDILTWVRNNFNYFLRWLWRDLTWGIVDWLAGQVNMDPGELLTLLDTIWYEGRLFWVEIQDELQAEFQNVLLLLTYTVNVLLTLASGVREGISGNGIAYIGADFGGIGGFIWDGVEFVNEVADLTPLSALNFIALGVITFEMMVWTGQKFTRILSAMD